MRKIFYLLGYLTDADVEWLIAHGSRQRIAAGTVLIREGEPTQALYILLGGILEVSFATPSGGPPIRLGCGDVVGEMSFLDARPPSATVTAADNAVVLAIPRQPLAAKLDTDSVFAARFYHSIAVFLTSRLRETNQRLAAGQGRSPGEDIDELDPSALHTIQRAAGRFDRILRRLLDE